MMAVTNYYYNKKDYSTPIAKMFSIAGNVSTPIGLGFPTLWKCLIDLTNGVYYFKSSFNLNTISIRLTDFNFTEGVPILKCDPTDPELHGNISHNFESANLIF